MMATILIIISILLFLGIIYTIYSISVAEVDEGPLEEDLDENAFAKPPGWKVGKMPKDLPKPIKITRSETKHNKKSVSLRDLISKLHWEKFSKTKNSNTV
ncbi:MAG: hypothetical protein WD426_00630 [Anditalea sp.]